MNIRFMGLFRFFTFIILVLIAVLSGSCDKQSQAEKDEEEILSYLSANSLTAEKTSTGIYYIIDVEGSGAHPSDYAFVKVYYEGRLTNDNVFDENDTNEPAGFYLSQVIEGWQIGIPLFRKGGKGTLFIPSRHGYGTTGTSSIPKNSVLIFDIELLDFQEPSKQ